MAKQVKGVRANKPNDSFGVVNNSNLYRGKYREDVYKDDEEEEQKSNRNNLTLPKRLATQKKHNNQKVL